MDNSAQDVLLGFPVLVVLTPEDFNYGATNSDGSDLRFVDDNHATELPHEIEVWSPGGTSMMWVQVPIIDGFSDTDSVYLYYGNADTQPTVNQDAVWSADYRGVWHLNENVEDASPHANHGIDGGSTDATGIVGGAQGFSGADDYIDTAGDDSLDNLFAGGATLSVWIYPTGWGNYSWGRIVDKAQSPGTNGGFSLMVANEGNNAEILRFAHDFDGAIGTWDTPSNSITLDTWQHIAIAYDASSPDNQAQVYINGEPVVTTQAYVPMGTALPDEGNELRIGNFSNVADPAEDRCFEGTIDEVRVAVSMRSADWLRAEYLSTSNQFASIGVEQALP
jgi:hypothetical protein